MVIGSDGLDSSHRQVLVDDVDVVDSLANELCVASGGIYYRISAKFCPNFVENLPNESSIADNGSNLHGFSS